jgi:alanine racemase
MTVQEIAKITNGELSGNHKLQVSGLTTDSRQITNAENLLFIAIDGGRRDGHSYISDVYKKGVRCFLIQKKVPDLSNFKNSCFIRVKNTMEAMQQIVAYKRKQFNIPVVGITGSNGKTMVKEWLVFLLEGKFSVTKSPKSYNSQIGVPLSVWNLSNQTDYAVFEAGISMPGEMKKLEKIIQPTSGIFTSIGQAHQSNFDSIQIKVAEKLKLFEHSGKIIYCKDDIEIHNAIIETEITDKAFSWSEKEGSDLFIKKISKNQGRTIISYIHHHEPGEIKVPFQDYASIKNVIHCLAYLLAYNLTDHLIFQRFDKLPAVEMRMEIIQGSNNCVLVNDTYNSDLESLRIALDFIDSHSKNNEHTVILSDIKQTGIAEKELYIKVSDLIKAGKVKRLIGIGNDILSNYPNKDDSTHLYNSTASFLKDISSFHFENETILIKGARQFHFEQIVQYFQHQVHNTVLEINLNAVRDNLNYFKSLIKTKTKIMVMVKAFSYGSGLVEIAQQLQFDKVDYLAVAYPDEGKALRNAGVHLSIMVMASDTDNFDDIIKYNLEPVIFSFRGFENFTKYLSGKNIDYYPVHLEFDTGMKRLGFDINDLDQIATQIKQNKSIKVVSVFSHLAASDEKEHKEFTINQINQFKQIISQLRDEFHHSFIAHLANSAGIENYPNAQFDMVRLGIGLYGIGNSSKARLQTISTFKTRIAQIKIIPKGESVGYSRKGKCSNETTIGIIPVGYADGFNRLLSNGTGEVYIKNKRAKVIGNVCMDMTMIDLTGIHAEVGDEVEIFGENINICEIADKLNTIPYEILTSISRRVKRVYIHE